MTDLQAAIDAFLCYVRERYDILTFYSDDINEKYFPLWSGRTWTAREVLTIADQPGCDRFFVLCGVFEKVIVDAATMLSITHDANTRSVCIGRMLEAERLRGALHVLGLKLAAKEEDEDDA